MPRKANVRNTSCLLCSPQLAANQRCKIEANARKCARKGNACMPFRTFKLTQACISGRRSAPQGRRTPSRYCCTTRFSLPTTFPYRLRCATSVYTCTLPHVSSLPRIGSTVWVCSEASMCVRDTRDQNCSRSVPWGADKQVDRPACNLVMLLCMFCGGMFEASLKHGWIPRMQSNNLQCQPSHGTK